ncbi:MAG: hypothetical protein WC099_01585 [Candidatus Paceibacterota bacterium]
MQKNPFQPEYFINPNIQGEMEKMHTSEYMEYLDHTEYDEDEIHDTQKGFSSPESISKNKTSHEYSEDDQRVFREIEHGSFAHVHELTTLSPTIAGILVQRLEFLNLAGITTLSSDTARYLGSHQGKLYLSGLKYFEPGVANALGDHRGYLDLARLETISLEDAHALMRQQGDLRLSSLRVSFDTAYIQELESLFDAFLNHEGELLLSSELQNRYELYKAKKQTFKKVI